jgi:hypothetical protein
MPDLASAATLPIFAAAGKVATGTESTNPARRVFVLTRPRG